MRLLPYSAVMSVLIVAGSGAATWWLPQSWRGWAWAGLALVLFVAAGLLYRPSRTDPPS